LNKARSVTRKYCHRVCTAAVYHVVLLEPTAARSYQTPVTNIKLLKTKRNLLYIRNQSVPRCKHFPPRL